MIIPQLHSPTYWHMLVSVSHPHRKPHAYNQKLFKSWRWATKYCLHLFRSVTLSCWLKVLVECIMKRHLTDAGRAARPAKIRLQYCNYPGADLYRATTVLRNDVSLIPVGNPPGRRLITWSGHVCWTVICQLSRNTCPDMSPHVAWWTNHVAWWTNHVVP